MKELTNESVGFVANFYSAIDFYYSSNTFVRLFIPTFKHIDIKFKGSELFVESWITYDLNFLYDFILISLDQVKLEVCMNSWAVIKILFCGEKIEGEISKDIYLRFMVVKSKMIFW